MKLCHLCRSGIFHRLHKSNIFSYVSELLRSIYILQTADQIIIVQKWLHKRDSTSSRARIKLTCSCGPMSSVLMEKELNNSPVCYLSSCQRDAILNWWLKTGGLLVTTILQRLEPMTVGRWAAAGWEGRVIVSPALIN